MVVRALCMSDAGDGIVWFEGGFLEVVDCGVNSTNRKHLAQKPLPLFQGLIRSTCPPGGLILGPFAGSASTGVAAIKEGRSFVSFEKDPHYLEVAQDRLEIAERIGIKGS